MDRGWFYNSNFPLCLKNIYDIKMYLFFDMLNFDNSIFGWDSHKFELALWFFSQPPREGCLKLESIQPPKFNIAPEKWWLEDEFPFGIA